MLKKIFFSITLLVAIVTGVKADEVTADYFRVDNSALNAINTTTGTKVDVLQFSTSASSFTVGSNQLKVLKNSTATVTVSVAGGKTITGIALEWKDKPNNMSTDVGELSADATTWTGSATAITFTNAESSDRQIKKITVTYTGDYLENITSTTMTITGRTGYSSSNIYALAYSTSNNAYGLGLKAYCNSSVQVSNNNTITLYSPKALKSVTIKNSNSTAMTMSASTGAVDENKKWTAANNETTNVTFTNTSGSNFTPSTIEVEFVQSGPVDPEFSLSKASIGTDETAQIKVTGKDNLDGISFDGDVTFGTDGIVSVDASGVVTPIAAGTTTINFNTSAVADKYNAGSGNLSITVTAPVVATPTLTAGGGFLESKTVEIACTTDGATIKYSTDNENWATYTEALNITETTTVYAKAEKDGYTTSAVASETYTKAAPHTWATVSTATTWDWTKLSTSEVKLTDATTPAKSEEFLMGDMDGLILTQNVGYNPATFNADALKLIAEYPVRSTSFTQATQVKFKTSVPGTVKVTYSNTGGSRPYRHIEVNGVLSAEGSASTSQTSTEDIAVAAGEVTIKVYIPDATTPQAGNNDEVGYTMARIYKIEFTPAEASTINLNAKGYATYSKGNDFMFAGAKAYKMALNETAGTITGSEVKGKIKAGEGILFRGEAGAEVTILATTGATALEDNDLIGSTGADGNIVSQPTYCYTLSGDTFMKYTGALVANKAFFGTDTEITNSLQIVFEGEGEATAINNVIDDVNVNVPVKVIKNGKLYIGNFNVAGQQVK